MPLPLVFDVDCINVGGEVVAADNREYLLFAPTDDTGTGDVLENGGRIEIIVTDTGQQGLFTAGTSYRVTIAALP